MIKSCNIQILFSESQITCFPEHCSTYLTNLSCKHLCITSRVCDLWLETVRFSVRVVTRFKTRERIRLDGHVWPISSAGLRCGADLGWVSSQRGCMFNTPARALRLNTARANRQNMCKLRKQLHQFDNKATQLNTQTHKNRRVAKRCSCSSCCCYS